MTRRKYLGGGIALGPFCNGRDLSHVGDRQVLIGPQIYDLTAALTAIIEKEHHRRATLDRELIPYGNHVLPAEALPHLNRHILPGEHSDHGEGVKPLPFRQLIGDEVSRPRLIRFPRLRAGSSWCDGFPSSWHSMAHHQAFFPVEAIHEFLAHGPPVSIEQHPNLPVAVPDPRLGHLPHPLPERGAGVAMTPIVVSGPRTADDSAGSPLTHRIRGAQIPHHNPLPRGP